MAIKREIAEIEAELALAEASNFKVGEQLLSVQQQRSTAEEELVSENIRLKVLLDELNERTQSQENAPPQEAADTSMSKAELEARIERTLISVFEDKLDDTNWALDDVPTRAGSGWGGSKVRVECNGAEIYWALLDNYTFEMLLQDAARYWDLPPLDCALHDERGSIWPLDSYVNVELGRSPGARVELRIKPIANAVDEDAAFYGAEGVDDSESEEESELDFLKVASLAEDELLIAQARGKAVDLTHRQKVALRRKLFRELRIFFFFIVNFVIVVYQRRSVKNAFSVQQAISTAFVEEEFGDFNEKTFMDIATSEELFDWFEGPLLDGIYPDEHYNGETLPDGRRGYVMEYNKVVGKIRLRQLRVERGAGCEVAEAVSQTGTLQDGTPRKRWFAGHCYPPYSPEVRSSAPFGADPRLHNLNGSSSSSGFTFSTEEENNLVDNFIRGQLSFYDGSGYVRDLSGTNRTEYLETLQELKSNLWIDEQSRAVVISLNLYNGNLNFFCLTRFLIEFSTSGTVVPSANMKVLSRDLWDDEYFGISEERFDYSRLLILVPEFSLYTFTLGYLCQFIARLWHVKRITGTLKGVLYDLWNVVELALIGCMNCSVLFRLFYFYSPERLSVNLFIASSYQEMGPIAASYNRIFTTDSMVLMVISFKCLKFFRLQRNLDMLRSTLSRAASDLFMFTIMMVIMFGGFSFMALNIFGTQVPSYRNLFFCVGTLFLMLLGEFDYDEMRDVDETWAIIYFIIYVLFMFFIVLNIFLAILNDAYTVIHASAVWEELDKSKKLSLREKFEVRKAIWRERKNIRNLKKLKKRRFQDARKKKKQHEKKEAERDLFEKVRTKKRRAAKKAAEEGAGEERELSALEIRAARRKSRAEAAAEAVAGRLT